MKRAEKLSTVELLVKVIWDDKNVNWPIATWFVFLQPNAVFFHWTCFWAHSWWYKALLVAFYCVSVLGFFFVEKWNSYKKAEAKEMSLWSIMKIQYNWKRKNNKETANVGWCPLYFKRLRHRWKILGFCFWSFLSTLGRKEPYMYNLFSFPTEF